MAGSETQRAVEAVWRIESARLIAALARMVHDVGLAEELAQDALVAALEQWPAAGVPRNPGAWLMTVAKRRAVDLLRREERYDRKLAQVGRDLESTPAGTPPEFDAAVENHIEDDLLRLMFVACHPVLSTDARVALTLRLLGGLTTDEIARAFLVPEPTVAKRIVRAKKTLTDANVPFEVPEGAERAARLSSVLEVIYLVFNEGYSATAGDDWMRPELCAEALRLGRVLAELAPAEPEVHGLVALMEIQASRSAARVGPNGEPVTLLDQDRSRWNRAAIRRGLAALDRAIGLSAEQGPAERGPADRGPAEQGPAERGPADRGPAEQGPAERPGPYTLQAAIAACHARAGTAGETDWLRMAALYEALATLAPSPVVELNRAVALGMAYGPAAGLAHVDRIVGDPALTGYHLLPSVRGDLLAKLGRRDEARTEFERAASLTRNARERALLLDRASACASSE